MILQVDDASALPPFEQIRQQIETMVIAGVLPIGSRLPSIRQLASDLGLAPGTVARAYSTLESAGIVRSKRGRGTIVASPVQRLGVSQTNDEIRKAAEVFVRRVYQLGASPDDAVRIVRESLTTLERD